MLIIYAQETFMITWKSAALTSCCCFLFTTMPGIIIFKYFYSIKTFAMYHLAKISNPLENSSTHAHHLPAQNCHPMVDPCSYSLLSQAPKI